MIDEIKTSNTLLTRNFIKIIYIIYRSRKKKAPELEPNIFKILNTPKVIKNYIKSSTKKIK